MTPATDFREPLAAIAPPQSLEDLHYTLAQEITKAMIPQSTSPSSITTPLHHTRPRSRTSPLPLITKTPSVRSHTQPRAPIVKPSPAEEELVRRIHRKVGGPSKLSTYDEPAKVRHVVIEALALEQTNPSDVARIRKGQLSVFERRVVRTVTNRGAAVRSRMRQRKEVAHLKDELRASDMRVRQLESFVRALCAKYSESLPDAFLGRPPSFVPKHAHQDADTEPETDSFHSVERVNRCVPQQQQQQQQQQQHQQHHHHPQQQHQQHPQPVPQPQQEFASFDQDLFGTLMDQMIAPAEHMITQPWA